PRGCLEALTALAARIELRRLVPLLEHPTLRPAALTGLGNTGDPAAARPLLACLADRARAVREAATVALDRLQALLPADRAGREEVARTVAAGLNDEAEPLLVQALLEGPVRTR